MGGPLAGAGVAATAGVLVGPIRDAGGFVEVAMGLRALTSGVPEPQADTAIANATRTAEAIRGHDLGVRWAMANLPVGLSAMSRA